MDLVLFWKYQIINIRIFSTNLSRKQEKQLRIPLFVRKQRRKRIHKRNQMEGQKTMRLERGMTGEKEERS